MNEQDIIKQHFAKIGTKGGKAGTGESKRRKGSEEALKKYWQEVRDGLREAPKKRGRPPKTSKQVAGLKPARPAQAKKTKPRTEKVSRISQAPKVKVGRNEPCPCGSGLKFKKCCRR